MFTLSTVRRLAMDGDHYQADAFLACDFFTWADEVSVKDRAGLPAA
jgi:hypothetical protein